MDNNSEIINGKKAVSTGNSGKSRFVCIYDYADRTPRQRQALALLQTEIIRIDGVKYSTLTRERLGLRLNCSTREAMRLVVSLALPTLTQGRNELIRLPEPTASFCRLSPCHPLLSGPPLAFLIYAYLDKSTHDGIKHRYAGKIERLARELKINEKTAQRWIRWLCRQGFILRHEFEYNRERGTQRPSIYELVGHRRHDDCPMTLARLQGWADRRNDRSEILTGDERVPGPQQVTNESVIGDERVCDRGQTSPQQVTNESVIGDERVPSVFNQYSINIQSSINQKTEDFSISKPADQAGDLIDDNSRSVQKKKPEPERVVFVEADAPAVVQARAGFRVTKAALTQATAAARQAARQHPLSEADISRAIEFYQERLNEVTKPIKVMGELDRLTIRRHFEGLDIAGFSATKFMQWMTLGLGNVQNPVGFFRNRMTKFLELSPAEFQNTLEEINRQEVKAHKYLYSPLNGTESWKFSPYSADQMIAVLPQVLKITGITGTLDDVLRLRGHEAFQIFLEPKPDPKPLTQEELELEAIRERQDAIHRERQAELEKERAERVQALLESGYKRVFFDTPGYKVLLDRSLIQRVTYERFARADDIEKVQAELDEAAARAESEKADRARRQAALAVANPALVAAQAKLASKRSSDPYRNYGSNILAGKKW